MVSEILSMTLVPATAASLIFTAVGLATKRSWPVAVGAAIVLPFAVYSLGLIGLIVAACHFAAAVAVAKKRLGFAIGLSLPLLFVVAVMVLGPLIQARI